jgi:hypothetical protein
VPALLGSPDANTAPVTDGPERYELAPDGVLGHPKFGGPIRCSHLIGEDAEQQICMPELIALLASLNEW